MLRARHIAERLGLEEANMLEYNQLTRTWDKTMADYETNAQKLSTREPITLLFNYLFRLFFPPSLTVFGPSHVCDFYQISSLDSMKQKHTEGLEEFRKQLLEKQMKPKFSTELLNYRKIQDHLAKAKDYTEANKVKLKADALEVVDLEKWQQKRQECISQQEENFRQLKLQEYSALQKRIQSGREAQKKQRNLEFDRLSQRYQNVKKELEAQHNLERSRIEKQYYQQKIVP